MICVMRCARYLNQVLENAGPEESRGTAGACAPLKRSWCSRPAVRLCPVLAPLPDAPRRSPSHLAVPPLPRPPRCRRVSPSPHLCHPAGRASKPAQQCAIHYAVRSPCQRRRRYCRPFPTSAFSSRVSLLSRFRAPLKLQGEGGYYLTNMQGAISFIQSVDASQLTIDKGEPGRQLCARRRSALPCSWRVYVPPLLHRTTQQPLFFPLLLLRRRI